MLVTTVRIAKILGLRSTTFSTGVRVLVACFNQFVLRLLCRLTVALLNSTPVQDSSTRVRLMMLRIWERTRIIVQPVTRHSLWHSDDVDCRRALELQYHFKIGVRIVFTPTQRQEVVPLPTADYDSRFTTTIIDLVELDVLHRQATWQSVFYALISRRVSIQAHPRTPVQDLNKFMRSLSFNENGENQASNDPMTSRRKTMITRFRN